MFHEMKIVQQAARIFMVVAFMACVGMVSAHQAQAQTTEAKSTMDYKAFLQKVRTGVLATVDGDQPRTRVFQHLWSDGDKAYFCTGASKAVYQQMQKNPRVSFCVWDPDTATVLSVDGPVVFVADQVLKQRALDENPGIKGIYKTADNPEFVLFYIDADSIYSFDFENGKQVIK